MIENWQKSFDQVMKSEGGYSDDKRDSGNWLPDGRAGATNLGVTQRAWERYLGRKVTQAEMRALTKPLVQPFYKTEYWNKVRGDELPAGIDYLCFDLAVNAGPGRAIMTLQTALGVNSDGGLGPVTMGAVKSADPADLIDSFTAVKIRFYKALNQPVYERGWINRANEAQLFAHSMLG